MNVLLISQCSKKALTETRRILDQFAERRGERTWQTAITSDGLSTLRKLLRSTARKNTAVACHWIRGHNQSELMWIVGDARQFNSEGAVPTDTTTRDLLRTQDENDWNTGEDIRLLAALAALLHDLGKSSVAFQDRLHRSMRNEHVERNLYRHEWVSLRLFLAFVGEDGDEKWLARLMDERVDGDALWTDSGRYRRDGIDVVDSQKYPFLGLEKRAPLAAAIGWLIVTHHRLPVMPEKDQQTGKQAWLGARCRSVSHSDLEGLPDYIAHDWNEVLQEAELTQIEAFWSIRADIPVVSAAWKSQASKLARRLLSLRLRCVNRWLDNPYVMHLARLCLMLADHHYSSLGLDRRGKPLAGRQKFLQSDNSLLANTTRNQHGRAVPNQSLLEHLLGVAHGAASIAFALPGFERYLPRLTNHRSLRKRARNPRFLWQDKAFDAALSIRGKAMKQGAFIVNMASTGCGKTLANARILYALADPQQGMRATYALGLRTLTLQTGRSYRNDLHLDEDELAILVGGSASSALFEFYEAQAEQTGSASIQGLLEEDCHVIYEGQYADHPLLARALANPDIRKLLSAPMLVCTVDHLTPATESQRAGRQIAPILRLMSTDLVLDELDDYDLNDLPAVTRLIYWAGMLGARVILSSATLPPALVEGMHMAYCAGRRHYFRNRGLDTGQAESVNDIPCLWVDEFGARVELPFDSEHFAQFHQQFVLSRVSKLAGEDALRRAEILTLDLSFRQPAQVYAEFAAIVRDGCLRLHQVHAETDPLSGKQVSFGLVRMANIEPLIEVARSLYELGTDDNAHIHLCVYHSRFPLVQRSAIEHLLDTTFNRRENDGLAIYQLPSVRRAVDGNAAPNQLFVVLASPVCEVGRDWDLDWALAEPSSMRSLIQLAGRVQRHRRKAPAKPNMLLLDTPIKQFLPGSGKDGIYHKPGFEKGPISGQFRLASPWLHDLLKPEEYQVLNAVPRICPKPRADWKPREGLVDLEHMRMVASMYPHAPQQKVSMRNRVETGLEPDEAAPAWQYSRAMLSGILSQQQPFRDEGGHKTTNLVFRPDEYEENLLLYRVEHAVSASRQGNLYVAVEESKRKDLIIQVAPGIGPWKEFELLLLLQQLAHSLDISLDACSRKMGIVEVLSSEQGWYWHPWLGFAKQ